VGAAIELSPTGMRSTGCALSSRCSSSGASSRRNSAAAMRWMLATSRGSARSARADPAHSSTGVIT
jgi:hypothetical protein